MKNEKNKDYRRLIKLIKNPFFYMLLGIFYGYFFINNVPSSPTEILFLIATVLLITHILYGGYFLFKNGGKLDFIISLLSFGVLYGLYILIISIGNPLNWFISLIIIFIIAIPYHQYNKRILDQEYLKEFCNYKTSIEIKGILLSVLGIILISLFENYIFTIGLINLIMIIKLNYTIINDKEIYKIKYSVPKPLKNPLVSIIIISFNEQKYIGKLLKSIAQQKYKNYEIIVVDDHSKDDTLKILERYKDKLSIKVVSKDICGPSRSRNYGAKFARGELILFLDADVILPNNFLEDGIREFSNKKLSVAGNVFKPITNKLFDKFSGYVMLQWIKLMQYHNPRAIGNCIWIRPKLHKKTLFDESIKLSEDFDYISRAVKCGKFRILSSNQYNVSWRRFEKENSFLLALKYIYLESYRNIFGKIKREVISYRFGDY